MKLATLDNGARNGRLVVVSRDLKRAVDAGAAAPTFLSALEHWSSAGPKLSDIAERLEAGAGHGSFDFDETRCLPRCRAPRNGSTALANNHLRLMALSTGRDPEIEMNSPFALNLSARRRSGR